MSKCVVCKQELKKHTYQKYNPATGPIVYGPGGEGQFFEVIDIWCEQCGLSYRHEPKRIERGITTPPHLLEKIKNNPCKKCGGVGYITTPMDGFCDGCNGWGHNDEKT